MNALPTEIRDNATQRKMATAFGWLLTGLVAALMVFSAAMKFARPPQVTDQFVGALGYSRELIVPIGVAELVCVLLFLIPRTAVLGAVLLTGYLGGAIATHVRVNDVFITPAIAGLVVWLALFLRMPRLRAVLPLVRTGT